MGKYKVFVYAISKNESQFAARWMDSMKEADAVYVLDTGSTDDTVEALTNLGAHVTVESIAPWRFDVARNRSLELVPTDADICVCTDLDEVFHPGWRELLEQAWEPTLGQLRYRYTWSFQPNGREGVVFWIEKIHRRHGYRWVNPVHEVLSWQGPGAQPPAAFAEGIQLDHHPDNTKSRGQYLPLLEIAVAEDPENDRNMHYLGREYFFHSNFEKAISTLKRHLQLPSATWADERCASMRYIAKCYVNLQNLQEAQRWYLRAIAQAPHLREPWLDFAMLAYENEDWYLLLWLTGRALAIQERPRTYITEATSWGSLPHDLASLGYFYTGQYQKALYHIDRALEIEPSDPRLLKNRELILPFVT